MRRLSNNAVLAGLSIALAGLMIAAVPLAAYSLGSTKKPAAGQKVGAGIETVKPAPARKPRSLKPPGKRGVSRFGLAWPVSNTVTSGFGPRRLGTHHGVDIACSTGDPVFVSRPGRVIKRGFLPYYGRAVIVQHGPRFRTLYAHMSAYLVRPGQWLPKDTAVGLCGSTGRSTGPHVHFEVYGWGRIVNPMPFLPKRCGRSAANPLGNC